VRELLEKLEGKGAMYTFSEASYPGNLGATEMFAFYRMATKKQIDEMERLLKVGDYDKVRALLNKVTGSNLSQHAAMWNPKAVHRRV
jgi:hypothetical protein